MCSDNITSPKKNGVKKGNLSQLSFRAGTNLTYNRRRGKGKNSKTINDIAYIKPRDGGVYIAISMETGFTALGETPEEAYSCLVFKLYDALREIVDFPNARIGQAVSKKLRKESKQGTRMPQDRQMRSLLKGIEAFISIPRKNIKLSNLSFEITTPNLENTVIDVKILDTFEVSQTESDSIPVH